jgi:hypothetical protein
VIGSKAAVPSPIMEIAEAGHILLFAYFCLLSHEHIIGFVSDTSVRIEAGPGALELSCSSTVTLPCA